MIKETISEKNLERQERNENTKEMKNKNEIRGKVKKDRQRNLE